MFKMHIEEGGKKYAGVSLSSSLIKHLVMIHLMIHLEPAPGLAAWRRLHFAIRLSTVAADMHTVPRRAHGEGVFAEGLVKVGFYEDVASS